MATVSLLKLREAFAHFVVAEKLNKIGEYRKADAELRKSDKLMKDLATEYSAKTA